LFKEEEVLFKGSYEIGGLKMLSLFHSNNNFSLARKADMEQYVLAQIKDLIEATKQFKPLHLIGAAGAFETLYDLECIENCKDKLEGNYAEELSVEIFY